MEEEKFEVHKINLNGEVFIIRRKNDRSILSRLKIYERMKERGHKFNCTFLEAVEIVNSLCEKFNCNSNGILFSREREGISDLLNFLYKKELI